MKKLEELGISPVPWSAKGFRYKWINDASEHMICYGLSYMGGNEYRSEAEEHANASLIKAAPKLYYYLREAVIEMCVECPRCGKYPDYACKNKNCECFQNEWRKALAEAAGEIEK